MILILVMNNTNIVINLLQKTLWGNTLWSWLLSLTLILAVFLIFRLVRVAVVKRIHGPSEEKAWDRLIDNLIQRTRDPLILLVILWIGVQILQLPPKLSGLLNTLAVIAMFLQLGLWGNAVVSYVIARKVEEAKEDDLSRASAYGAISFISRVILWSLVVLLALDNLGFNITTLVAGLGVGSVAIALAVQNILGDVFCSISILLDKPFEVGDFIVVGDKLGVVDRIGIKSTRIKALQGEQLVISNSDLTGSRIQNFKQMNERRVPFRIGVIHQTPAEVLEKIPEMIKTIIENTPNTRFDRAHFCKFGDFSLEFEIVYYVLSSDYNMYMDAQQEINLAMCREFEKAGIKFAYPTQTVFVEKAASVN